jgi:hypothetical protein
VRQGPPTLVPWIAQRCIACSTSLPGARRRIIARVGARWTCPACRGMQRLPSCVRARWRGAIPPWRWGVGVCWGSTSARARRSKPPRWWRRSSPACGHAPSCSRMAGKPRAQRGSRLWGLSLVVDGGGRGGGSPNPGWAPHRISFPPRSSRSVPRRGGGWRSAGGEGWAVPAALGRRDAGDHSARRSRRPVWHAGMARCGGWSPPCGAALAVCPGAQPATGADSG